MAEVDHHDHDDLARGPLAFDSIRIATLATLGILAVVVAILVVFLVTNVREQRQTQECLQAQVDQLNASYIAAIAAGRQDRQAQRELLTAPGDTRDERVAALQRYLQQLDDADRTRAGSPPPTRRCA